MTSVSRRQHTSYAAHEAATFGSRTDVGCVRDHNEDNLIVAPPLFVVADGMGGHAAGEVASEITVNVLAETAPVHADANELANAVMTANHAVLRAAEEGRGRHGMGTTCTAALLEGERLVVAQVGDSRAYLLHQGELQQITRDHSLMADMIEAGQLTPEEARVHPQRSVITRALGSDPLMQPDLYEINVESGDRLLLCSDGLSGMVCNEEIERTMLRIRDPQQCASALVDKALANGGHDNVTVIIADVVGYEEKRTHKLARKTKINIGIVLALLLVIIAGAFAGFNYLINNHAYLAVHEGKVAIYKGYPGSLLGIPLSEMEEETSLEVADLQKIQPALVNRLQSESGVEADSVDAARKLVETYEEQIAEREQALSAVASGAQAGASNAGTPGASGASATSGASGTSGTTTPHASGSATAASQGTSQGSAQSTPQGARS